MGYLVIAVMADQPVRPSVFSRSGTDGSRCQQCRRISGRRAHRRNREDTGYLRTARSIENQCFHECPVDGQVQSVHYFPGKFVNADLDKASLENERNALIIHADNGQMVTCVQVAGLIARRILCYVKGGERLRKGQRFGFIRFGSRVDVYLPLSARPKVTVGDKVYATETILAELSQSAD